MGVGLPSKEERPSGGEKVPDIVADGVRRIAGGEGVLCAVALMAAINFSPFAVREPIDFL